MNQHAFAAIILGAGASSRMGRPKLLLPWGETSIVGHLVAQWNGLGAKQVSIVTRPRDEKLSAELDRLDFPPANRIENPEPERGMFSSIQCAAKWPGWKSDIASWTIVLGDQPHLRAETLRALIAFSHQHPDEICQPCYQGRARHPVFLPRAVFEKLKVTCATTLKEFLNNVSHGIALCHLTDPGLEFDLDTSEDYHRVIGTLL